MSKTRLSVDASKNKRLFKLRKEVIDARGRWENLVKNNKVARYTAKGVSERSPLKVLYIARSGKWWNDVKRELAGLQAKIEKAGYASSRKPRTLWLPEVIENPRMIRLQTYPAISVRKVSVETARDFARKAGCAAKLSSSKAYFIKSITGRNYKLLVTYESNNQCHRFTEWAVCIFQNRSSMPCFKKDLNQSAISKAKFEGAICTHRKGALYERELDSYHGASNEEIPEDDTEWA